MAEVKKPGKKSRKHGRNKLFCEHYARTGKRAKSHVRRILKHLERYGGGDLTAKHALARYRAAS